MNKGGFKRQHIISTPVLFLIFNRPESTFQVFKAIQKVKPLRLFIAADGPRLDKPEDVNLCAKAREIATAVDWECDLKTLFRDRNLGCQRAVSSAIDWFFENVNEGIILEDDCLPHQTFFWFCQELLDRYKADERIFVISGNNFQKGQKHTGYSYYFSLFNHCWGWATFKRAWQYFDFDLSLWQEIKQDKYLRDILADKKAYKYWEKIFQNVLDGKINSWAYRWTFACWVQSGLSVLPKINLVQNIGFGKDATHTKGSGNLLSLPAHAMDFPLIHPPVMIRDVQADRFTQQNHFSNPSLLRKIIMRCSRFAGLRL
jgi:hypothetical protein